MGDLAGKNIPPPSQSPMNGRRQKQNWCDIREALPTTDVKWMKNFHLFWIFGLYSMVSNSSKMSYCGLNYCTTKQRPRNLVIKKLKKIHNCDEKYSFYMHETPDQ